MYQFEIGAERNKKAVQEDLRLTFLVAGDVLPTPRGEFGEFFPAGHGCLVPQKPAVSNAEGHRIEPHLFTSAAKVIDGELNYGLRSQRR